MPGLQLSSEFLKRLASLSESESTDSEAEHLPSLQCLKEELNISVPILREQLEVAKALGFVEVRPRTGIRRLPYSFLPAVRQSLAYALALDPAYFDDISELRNHLEASFWHEAVHCLAPGDIHILLNLVKSAWSKLRGQPVIIPHREHRQLHLTIFSRLDNPFVMGFLEGYWDAYEAVGLNLYADFGYLEQVWSYHQQMVDSISKGDFEAGYKALIEHKDLLDHRKNNIITT